MLTGFNFKIIVMAHLLTTMRLFSGILFCCAFSSKIIFAQSNPVALRSDIQVEFIKKVPAYCARIAIDPVSKALIYAETSGKIHRVTFSGGIVKDTVLYTTAKHHVTNIYGMAFFDSILYLVGNEPVDTTYKFGLVVRGKLQPNGIRLWDTVAVTQYYPAGNTTFDHGFGGIIPTPAGDSLIICSGSRTDHGEVASNGDLFPGIREVPLTSAAFCISSASKNLVLPADEDGLAPFLYADGLRNTFDLAYTSDGDLLGCENSGERDDPDEINWVRKGLHYGFPWIMGGNYNPQQYPGYDPDADIMLNKNRYGYKNGFFYDDPDFPPKPTGLIVNPGIENYGPDADYFRDTTTGIVMQAGDLEISMNSFTSHRSPIGLIFDYDHVLIEEFNGDGFMLGYQYEGDSAGNRSNGQTGTILDSSQDLVHLDFEKNEAGTNYKVNSTRIVGGFEKPVDACMLQNVVYVLEYSNKNNKASLWKVTLPVAASTITTADLPKEELCPGEEVTVTFSTTGIFNSGNVFTVQLSDENGSFNAPIALGSIAAISSAAIEVIIPAISGESDDYRMRVVSTDPPVTGSATVEEFEIECPSPFSTQTVDITSTSAKVKWEEEDCAITYQVKYRIAGNNWINVNVNNDSKKLSGLLPSTTYEWKVRSKCVADPKVYSKYSPISSFTTLPLKETLIKNNNQSINYFNAYPNPAKDVTTLSFFLEEDSFLDISLLDMHCRRVKTVIAADFSEGSQQVQMDVAQFASGMYFLQLRSKAVLIVRKIIIE